MHAQSGDLQLSFYGTICMVEQSSTWQSQSLHNTHTKIKVQDKMVSNFQIQVLEWKQLHNTIRKENLRLIHSFSKAPSYICKWSIITFINALAHELGSPIEYIYLHCHCWILTQTTQYNISAPAPSDQSCLLRCLQVI